MRGSRIRFLEYETFRDAVFVFGAGASYADGAPLQKDLLPYILGDTDRKIRSSNLGNVVKEFIKDNFYIIKSDVPSMESVFGYIDYFLQVQESLGGELTVARISEIKESLIKLIYHTIATRSSQEKGVYRKFWELAKDRTLNIGVISTNYDTLLDEAFDFLYPDHGYIDYCIHLMNYDWYDKYHREMDPFNWWIDPRKPVSVRKGGNPRPIKIINLHGSLNWKYCNCCGQVLLTPWNPEIDLDKMGFIRYDYSEGTPDPRAIEFRCPLDGTRFDTLIVPPSYIKDLRHPTIIRLREEAAREIRCAKRMVFVGYSFSDADVHLKALFMKNLPAAAEVIVINRTIDERIEASYRSLRRNTKFCEVTFEEILADEQLASEIFFAKGV